MDIPAWTHDVFSLSKNTYFPHRPLQDLKSANVLTLNCPRSLERVCAHAHHSVVSNSATPWTTAHKALLSMEFSRQECTAVDAIPTPGEPSWLRDQTPSSASAALAVGSLPLHPMGRPIGLEVAFKHHSLRARVLQWKTPFPRVGQEIIKTILQHLQMPESTENSRGNWAEKTKKLSQRHSH